MTDTIVVLAENAVAPSDVTHVLSLHEGEELAYRVLVPADTERNMLVSLIDDLSLGELRDALETVLGREPSPAQARRTAAEQLADSIEAFRAAGREVTGEVVDDDPLPALRAAVRGGAREIVVVTYPHAVEDTFHRDWASRARDDLQVPVLHLYSGTSEILD